MQLTDDQQTSLRQWAEEGASLGEIQKRLNEQFDVNISYMEARFLISDLDVSIQDKDKPKRKDPDDDMPAAAGEDGMIGGGGGVSLTVDSVAVPGTMISGKARFSDGETAAWSIDQMGQLDLDTTTPGYQPTPEDLAMFQQELSKAASQAGF